MAISYGTSWIDICNRALGRLGKGSIADLISGGDLAKACNTFLGEAIETVLSARSWYGCRTRVQLARSATVPEYGFAYQYEIPADCVNLIELSIAPEEYVPEGSYILTDASEVYATYIPRPVSPAGLPGPIKKCISTHLAVLLSTPLTSSDQLRAILMAEDQQARTEAYGADERRAGEPTPTPWNVEQR